MIELNKQQAMTAYSNPYALGVHCKDCGIRLTDRDRRKGMACEWCRPSGESAAGSGEENTPYEMGMPSYFTAAMIGAALVVVGLATGGVFMVVRWIGGAM